MPKPENAIGSLNEFAQPSSVLALRPTKSKLYAWQKGLERPLRKAAIKVSKTILRQVCPFCKQHGPFIKKGFSGRKQRYQCKCCGKKFTYDALQLTYWSHQTPDKWATLIEDTISFQPLTKVEEDLEVSHPTAQNIMEFVRSMC